MTNLTQVNQQTSPMDLIRALYPLRLAMVAPANHRLIGLLEWAMPEGCWFGSHDFASGSEHNGWVIPDRWLVREAWIKQGNGNALIYDADHPLAVAAYSEPIDAIVSGATLREHLFTHAQLPDAVSYHCDWLYRPWERGWGFCVPWTVWDEVRDDAEYHVRIELNNAHQVPGVMQVGHWCLVGTDATTLVLAAHSCHAAQANDDLSGIAVGVEVMRRLAKYPKRRYTYRLIVAPEILGTVFLLRDHPELADQAGGCVFLEMLGSSGPLALQASFTGASALDRAANQYLRVNRPDYRWGAFRTVVGNDEVVWEAPGYEVPTVSLSRFPYPQYHSNLDTPDVLSEDRLEDAVRAVLGIIDRVETNGDLWPSGPDWRRDWEKPKGAKAARGANGPRYLPTGLVALSNPRYNLYKTALGDPTKQDGEGDGRTQQWLWNQLMVHLPRWMDGRHTAQEIAERGNLPVDEVEAYIGEWRAKGLVA